VTKSKVPQEMHWDTIFQDVTRSFAEGRPEEELRPQIRQWCDEARRRNLAPEQFLPVIKSQIIRVPGTRRMARDAITRDRALKRIVTMCIEEYYAQYQPDEADSA